MNKNKSKKKRHLLVLANSKIVNNVTNKRHDKRSNFMFVSWRGKKWSVLVSRWDIEKVGALTGCETSTRDSVSISSKQLIAEDGENGSSTKSNRERFYWPTYETSRGNYRSFVISQFFRACHENWWKRARKSGRELGLPNPKI